MAHNLATDKKTGKVAFASGNNQVAWHKLGQVVEGMMTAEQAIELAQLGYDVVKEPLYVQMEGSNILVPNHFATLRNDTKEAFGVVGNNYTIVQNRDAFGFFDSIDGEGAAIYETAGALGIGQKIFITAKMPNDIIKINVVDDVTEMYVVLTSSHDGNGSIIAMITPIRVVCQNTLNAALNNRLRTVRIRHTSSVKERLEQAHEVLGITHVLTQELNECFNYLAKKKVTDAKVTELAELIFPSASKKEEGEVSTRIENLRNKFLNTYQTGIGQSQILGTAWGVYNGVTHYLDHEKEYKNDSTKFDSIMGGESYKIAQNALNLLMAL